jgi:CheY-like chemotaxis protein
MSEYRTVGFHMEDMFMTKPMIMAIDDIQVMRIIICRILELAGYSVTLFEDGESARRAITSDSETFAAIVCDWHMPDMEGDEVYRAIKPHLNGRPFILYTSDPEEFKVCHPDISSELSVLNKNPEELINLLRTLLAS